MEMHTAHTCKTPVSAAPSHCRLGPLPVQILHVISSDTSTSSVGSTARSAGTLISSPERWLRLLALLEGLLESPPLGSPPISASEAHRLIAALADAPLIPLRGGGSGRLLATSRSGAFLPASFSEDSLEEADVEELEEDGLSASSARAAAVRVADSKEVAMGLLGEGAVYGFEEQLPFVDVEGEQAC